MRRIDGTVITMSGPESSFPAGSSYEISASKLNEEETKDVEIALRKKELEKNVNIAKYQAYDIKLIVDGAEVQPTGNVNVSFTGGEVAEKIENAEAVEVYHVDEENQKANDITGEADANSVVMETNHFSTYVITNISSSSIWVRIQHYLSETNSELYAEDLIKLEPRDTIEDMGKAQNYNIDKIVKIVKDREVVINEDQVITEDATYKVYYSPSTDDNAQGGVKFFDYQVKGSKSASINNENNYPKLETGNAPAKNQRFASGTINNNWSNNKYNTYVKIDNVGRNINNYDAKFGNGKAAYTGIITGVDIATGALKMGVNSDGKQLYEPGFFTEDTKSGKQIYDDYKLKFNRSGDTYTLSQVLKPDGSKAASAGDAFFPLDSVRGKYPDDANDGGHNDYFGMRYDIQFKIGDYVGEMNYKFTGDDDLWVVLDGEKVIIDLGGIHGAVSGEANLWEVLGIEPSNITEEQKEEMHTLTILYMERGASASNCKMEYTLPNSKIVEPTKAQYASLNFKKTNAQGNPLTGAEFSLYKADGETVILENITSATDGNVVIDNLYEGTYVLKETKAPENYVLSKKEWKVVVAPDENGNMIAQLKDGDEVITSIVNKTSKEYFDEQVNYDKTAEVVKWDDRTYKLTLTADSLTKTSTEGKVNAINVVLVLDVSGSMGDALGEPQLTGEKSYNQLNTREEYYFVREGTLYKVEYRSKGGYWRYKKESGEDDWKRLTDIKDYRNLTYYTAYTQPTRLDSLKEAAKTFVSTLAATSPESKVGIVTFSSSSEKKLELTQVTDKYVIETEINALTANGSTYPSDAITKAGVMLEGRSNKHVIFLTDGNCGYGPGSTDEAEVEKCINNASVLKDSGTEIHAIRFATNDAAYLQDIITDNQVYGATDTQTLIDSFNLIIEGSVTKVPISGATVVDYVDDRFVVTDDEGNVLEDGAKIYPDTTPIQGTLHVKDGKQYITWENQTIEVKDEKTGKDGWKAVIYVKAKDDFIGGNEIPTNGPESGIEINTGKGTFPQPTVNVKLLDISADNKEQTYFLGDTIQPAIFASELNDTVKVTELDGSTKVAVPDLAELTTEDLAKLAAGETVTKSYAYPGTTSVVGKFVYKYKAIKPEDQTVEDHEADTVGTDVEEYQLTVTYKALTVDERDEVNTTPVGEVVDSVTTSEDEGIYTVNVEGGRIEITKEITGNVEPSLEGDPIFTFKIVNTETNETWYRAVRFTDAKNTKIVSAEVLSNLPRGTYEVTELDTQRFDLEGIDITGSNCLARKTESSATFVIGKDKAGEANATAILGKVTFTNNKKDGGKRTDTDVVRNRFKKNADGTWTVSADKVPQKTEPVENKPVTKLNIDLEALKVDKFVFGTTNNEANN